VTTPQIVNTQRWASSAHPECVRKDGTVVFWSRSTRPITFFGRSPAKLVLVTDVTERLVISRFVAHQARLERSLKKKARDLEPAGKVLNPFRRTICARRCRWIE
jgi:hypothetical protein